MPSTLTQPRVDAVLSRLFAQADRDDEVASSLPEDRATRTARLRLTVQERADALQDIYMRGQLLDRPAADVTRRRDSRSSNSPRGLIA